MESVDTSVVTRVVTVVHRTKGEGSIPVAGLITQLRRAGLRPRLRKSKKMQRGRMGDVASVCSESTSAESGKGWGRSDVSETQIICEGICCAAEIPIVNKTLDG